MMNLLTPKQENFCLKYLETGNASEAYRRTYNVENMKPESVNRKAKELIDNVKIAARIKEIQGKAADLAVINRSEYLREMNRIAHSDIARLYHPDGKVKLPHELDEDTRRAVKGFKVDEQGRVEYQLWDKPAMLVSVAKIDGAFEKDNEQARPIAITKIELAPLSASTENDDCAD